jgi:carbohydrate kinase (thermoresistant glucokinase family)
MRTRAVFTTGVSGSGKSTIGTLLADRLGWAFVDADDLHPEANVAKMAAGTALTDEDRWPWLRAVGQRAAAEVAAADTSGRAGTSHEPAGVVVACSALRRIYRDLLRDECPGAEFVQLVASADLIALRLSHREDHFMPPSLLGSQLATLEPLAADEAGAVITVATDPATVVDDIVARLDLR